MCKWIVDLDQSIDAQSISNSFEEGTWGCEKNWEGVCWKVKLIVYQHGLYFSTKKVI
jgi:hypothetical protein